MACCPGGRMRGGVRRAIALQAESTIDQRIEAGKRSRDVATPRGRVYTPAGLTRPGDARTPQRPARPPSLATGLVVAGILVAGLVTGLLVDALLSTRPLGILLFPLAAAQVAALVVYRVFVASLGGIAHDREGTKESPDAKPTNSEKGATWGGRC